VVVRVALGRLDDDLLVAAAAAEDPPAQPAALGVVLGGTVMERLLVHRRPLVAVSVAELQLELAEPGSIHR
jgi:hypothetical protein